MQSAMICQYHMYDSNSLSNELYDDISRHYDIIKILCLNKSYFEPYIHLDFVT